MGRAVGGEPWEMVTWDPGLGLAAAGKHKHHRTRTVGLVALSLLATLLLPVARNRGSPPTAQSKNRPGGELRGLEPQSRSHPITFEIIIIVHDLEKKNKIRLLSAQGSKMT